MCHTREHVTDNATCGRSTPVPVLCKLDGTHQLTPAEWCCQHPVGPAAFVTPCRVPPPHTAACFSLAEWPPKLVAVPGGRSWEQLAVGKDHKVGQGWGICRIDCPRRQCAAPCLGRLCMPLLLPEQVMPGQFERSMRGWLPCVPLVQCSIESFGSSRSQGNAGALYHLALC